MLNIRLYIAWSLIVVFSIILVPKEFIHDLFGHEDTRCLPSAQATLESRHHHCAILQIIASVYNAPGTITISSTRHLEQETVFSVISSVSFPLLFHFNLRAPPQV